MLALSPYQRRMQGCRRLACPATANIQQVAGHGRSAGPVLISLAWQYGTCLDGCDSAHKRTVTIDSVL